MRKSVSTAKTQSITNLYWEQEASVKYGTMTSADVPMKKGVRQGCAVSPHLFSLHTEKVFRHSEDQPGLNTGGKYEQLKLCR